MRRAVIYLRVSTLDQTTANQERELREIAERMGCEVVKVYKRSGEAVKQTEPSVIGPVLRIIDAAGMRRRVLIASEHQQPIDEVRALAPEIPTNLPYHEIGAFIGGEGLVHPRLLGETLGKHAAGGAQGKQNLHTRYVK